MFNNSDISLINNYESKEYKDLINNILSSSNIKKAVFLLDAKTGLCLKKYNGIIIAEKELNIRHEIIKKYIISGDTYNDKYKFSYYR